MKTSPCKPSSTQTSFRPLLFKPQSTISNLHLLPRHHLRSQSQIQQNIKQKRAKSYTKLSMSIQKMNKLFSPTHPKEQQKQAHQKQLGAEIRYRMKVGKGKDSDRLKTCGFDLNESPKKKTILHRAELIQYDLDNSPLNTRTKTQYTEQPTTETMPKQSCLEQQLLYPKGIEHQKSLIPMVNKKAPRQPIPGVNFKQKRGKHVHSSSAVAQLTTYLHGGELLSRDREGSIEKLYRLRSEKKLRESPKQWHLYNCLNLTHLSLCTYVLIRPDKFEVIVLELVEVLTRVVSQGERGDKFVRMALQLHAYVNLKEVQLKINNMVVRTKMDSSSSVLTDQDFSLKNNTIITLWDLYIGMMLTCKIDLMWHLLYSLAHLQQHSLTTPDTPIHIDNDPTTLKLYEQTFMLKTQQTKNELGLFNTVVELKKKEVVMVRNERAVWGQTYDHSVYKSNNRYEYLSCISTCLQAAILFMDLLSHQEFLSLLPSHAHPCQLKYQVGYQFWQKRQHNFKHACPQYQQSNFRAFSVENSQQGTYCIVAYQQEDMTITVCNDCKVNMCLRDILGVKKWMSETFKRFRNLEKSKEKTNK